MSPLDSQQGSLLETQQQQPHMETNSKPSLVSLGMWFKGRWYPERALDLWLEDVGSILPVTLTSDFANNDHKCHCLSIYCPACTRHFPSALSFHPLLEGRYFYPHFIYKRTEAQETGQAHPAAELGFKPTCVCSCSFHCTTHAL